MKGKMKRARRIQLGEMCCRDSSWGKIRWNEMGGELWARVGDRLYSQSRVHSCYTHYTQNVEDRTLGMDGIGSNLGNGTRGLK